jgi:hypothetical protein
MGKSLRGDPAMVSRLVLAALAVGVFHCCTAGTGCADFESDLLNKFQKQNQSAAERLRQEAVRLLGTTVDRPAMDKVLGQLHDDRTLSPTERSELIRKLQVRLRAYPVPPAPVVAGDPIPLPGTKAGTNGKLSVAPAAAFVTSGGTVTVPDGGSRVLGSTSYLSEGRNEAGVPGLGKLPYVGRGFRNVGTGRSLGSVQTSISVRIIIMEEEEARFLQGK